MEIFYETTLCPPSINYDYQIIFFQQDTDPIHTSRVAKAYLEENELELLDWPAQSPNIQLKMFGIIWMTKTYKQNFFSALEVA